MGSSSSSNNQPKEKRQVTNFVEALDFVMEQECPYGDRRNCYTNDPDDRGGATNQGITQSTYTHWLKSEGKEDKSVKEITFEEVAWIYKKYYWELGKCSALEKSLGLIHFDTCVNCGVDRAVKLLQAAVSVKQDGKVGPVTLAAIRASDANLVALRYILERAFFYGRVAKRNSTQVDFLLKLWLPRLKNLNEKLKEVRE